MTLSDSDIRKLRAGEEDLLRSEVRSQPDNLSKLIRDDFVEFGVSGRIWRKADVLKTVGGATSEIDDPVALSISEDKGNQT